MKKQSYGLRRKNQSDSLYKKLFRVIVVLLLPVLMFSILTTQNLAKNFNYNPALGKSLLGNIYEPFAWVFWYKNFSNQYPFLFHSIMKWNLLVTLLVFSGVFFIFLYYKKPKRDIHPDLHGSARVADFNDIKKMNILDNDGVAIGGYSHKGHTHFLWHDGPEHLLAFAPTRSGKGVGLVIPTLLSWPHSMVIYDLKKENWQTSANWRRNYAGNTVLRLEPACNDGSAACFNPLEEIRLHTDYDVADAQNIAIMIMDDKGRGLVDHWERTGFDFLVGLILHVTYLGDKEKKPASLPSLAYAISDPDHDIYDVLEIMLNTEHKDNTVHPVVAQSARTMANKADKELSGVLSTVVSKLSLYRDPIISKNIAKSDFKISDIMNFKKPVSLYICVGATDKDRLRPFTRLIFSMIIRGLTTEIDNYKHCLLMLIDEFPSLGKIEVIQESLAFLAGYGIKCYLIAQDLSQLRGAYGKDEAVTSSCHVRVAFAPNKLETAEELSKMTGITTVSIKNVSESRRGKGIFSSTHQTISYQEQQRYLFTADEVMRLQGLHKEKDKVLPGDMLIFLAGQPVIYGTQILYFNDPVLQARAKLGAPTTSDRIISSPKDMTRGLTLAERFNRRHQNAVESSVKEEA